MSGWTLRQSLRTPGGVVRFDSTGSGPPLVLVHGTPWSSFSWHRIIPQLAAHFSVYFYDLLGYGRSDMRAGQDVSLGTQNGILVRLLDHWQLEKPFIAGHDFGGATVLRTHLLDNRDFAAVALLNAVALSPWGSPFFAHVRKHEAAFAGVPPYIHKAIIEAYIRGALGQDLPGEDFAGLVNPWLSSEGQTAFYRQIAQADERFTDEVEPLYRHLRSRSLVVWGEDDPWIPVATGQRLQKMLPRSRFVPVAKSGHLVQLEAPELVARTLIEFFLNLTSDGA